MPVLHYMAESGDSDIKRMITTIKPIIEESDTKFALIMSVLSGAMTAI